MMKVDGYEDTHRESERVNERGCDDVCSTSMAIALQNWFRLAFFVEADKIKPNNINPHSIRDLNG